jgi:hypothetical protein
MNPFYLIFSHLFSFTLSTSIFLYVCVLPGDTTVGILPVVNESFFHPKRRKEVYSRILDKEPTTLGRYRTINTPVIG